jgi:phenylpyruvate tautomerase PptA (4-oxalocrotonate tautomerase family)
MPICQCWYPQDMLTGPTKAAVATEITRIHCENTGAPASFVNVMFHQVDAGDCFVAGAPATRSYISGAIRHGRDLDARQTMLRELSRMWATVTGQSETELIVVLDEVDPANAMEAGLIVPEPGHEQEWLDENRSTLAPENP